MKIDLMRSSPLGDSSLSNGATRWEYQVGRRLIWVEFLTADGPDASLRAAQAVINDVWADIDGAIAYAETQSRVYMPDFWRKHDESGADGQRFDAWSITFPANAANPVYHIYQNHDFPYSDDEGHLPCVPEDFFLDIEWLGPQGYALINGFFRYIE